MESSDSEVGLVEAAKAQRAKRTPPRPLPPTAAAAGAPQPPPARGNSSDSEEGFDLIAAAKKQQRSSTAAQPPSPRHSHAASASPAAGGAPRVQGLRTTHSTPPTGTAGSSDSDSDEQDMVALAKQQGRQAKPTTAAARPGPASPAQRPASGGRVAASHRELNHSISLAPALADVQGAAAAPAPPPAAAAQPASPARSHQVSTQPIRTATVVVHEGVPVPPSLLDLAAGQLPQLPVAGQDADEQAAPLSGEPFAFAAGHSRQASSLQGAPAHSPRGSSQFAAAGSFRSPSHLAITQAARAEGSRSTLHAQAASSAPAASPAPSSPGLPLASLADLGDVLSSVVDDLKSSLSADIGRLEAGWAQRWREQADSTAELRGRLDRMATASDGQAQEVAGRLQVLQGELAQQRLRLEAVERASTAAPPAAGQASSCNAYCTAEAAPATAQGGQSHPAEGSGCGASSVPPAASVEAIMRRLSLLESRVGAQLNQIEAGVYGSGGSSSGGGSAPVSPLRPAAQGDPWAAHAQNGWAGSWSPPAGARTHSRAAQAAAVAAAAVWGSTNGTDGSEASLAVGSLPGGPKSARAGWCGSPDGLPASPRIRTASAPRPASAGPGGGRYQGSLEEGLSGYRAPSSCGPSRRSRAEVDAQVAATHALISGIHGQIAAIKSSLAGATGELNVRRAEAAATAQRLDALERTDRCMASVESANLSSVMALERRVRDLEGALAAAGSDAAAGRAEAKQARAALAALEWRVDKSADATIGTLKALEARQDKMRSELHAVAGTATLAGAKVDSLAGEVARLQRRVHGSGGAGSPLSPGGSKAAWRLY